MSTQFQWVFDNAATINYNRRSIVASTTTRSGIVRQASRGGQIWRFEVTMPAGLPWDQSRPYIEAIDAADRYTSGIVQINNEGYNSWLTPSITSLGQVSGSWIQGSRVVTTAQDLSAGDIIQLGTGKCYSVVTSDSGSTVVNRPVLDATGSGTIKVGPLCEWQVYCVNLPQWTIFDTNLVQWDGAFVFYEVI